MYSAAAFIIASSLLTRSLYTYTKNETWIPIVIATAVSYVIVSIYGRLARTYPGLSLIGINGAVFGTAAGKAVSALYLFYFFTLIVLNTRDLGSFVSAAVLPNTPISIVYIIFLLICAYAARKGAVPMTRYSVLITYLYIAAIVLNSLLLLNIVKPENLLPVFRLPVKNYLLGAHLTAMLPYCEVLVFLMFTPFLEKPEKTGVALRRGLLIAFAVLIVIIVRDVAVVGEFTLYTSMPTFNSIRLINVGDILTRLEIVFAVAVMMMLFFKVSILLFATVKGLSEVFGISQFREFTFIILALLVIYANAMFSSGFEQTKWFTTAATYSTFFLVVLPAVTLLVSELRKRSRKKETDEPVKL
jgi:spore germination protein KB